MERGDYYFLPRPRRFGESLLADTLRCLLEGNEALFRGLDIRRHCNWCGLEAELQHPKYIASSLKVLDDDKSAVIVVATQDQKVFD